MITSVQAAIALGGAVGLSGAALMSKWALEAMANGIADLVFGIL